ncbi:MAG TPA: Ig-like domain repeat protein [Edaphobacter sp.]|uniref:NHL domain-containing protein n=1 Tax=Edaphobacter sp. TaxID=1934404 RepID=UPI002BC1A4F9|nr:Ig-like domain repeat protein [Edaphobacter sp.]HUZ96194.1 Ig-like domain repeat protein [Edaphobacter sp.]
MQSGKARTPKAVSPHVLPSWWPRLNHAASRLFTIALVIGTGAAASGFRALAQTAPASNVQATAASLAAPAQVAYDTARNLYIADLNDNVIRKVDLAGIITTVAGTGEQGFSGDGGPATSAQLDSPAGVAVDASGTIYIADTHNHRIRKVSGGTITTVAGTGTAGFSGDGGAATSATLGNPTALAVDSSGNLYIADTDNHRIRKLTTTTTITTITTVAGNGEQGFSGDGGAATSASIDSPNGVAVDAAGTIYIGDTHNQLVRAVNASGTISTLAGNRNKTFGGDGGPGTSASLARPRGLSVDAQGNLYVADSDNNRIRLITNPGTGSIITTVAGNGSQGFAGDGGPAVNAILDTPRAPAALSGGAFALSDTNNQLVRLVGMDGVIHTIAGQNSGTGGGKGFSESLVLSGASSVPYGSGSLTATFSNASLTATGQVSLLDITSGSTSVGSAPLTSNVATISTATLLPGSHRLVASYGGDALNPAITSSVFVLTVAPPPITDFTLTATGATTQSVNPGQTATFSFALQPQGGVLNTPISLTASGLPPGATVVFTPTTIASGSGATTLSLSIKTASLKAANTPPSSPLRAPLLPITAAVFLLPVLRNKRLRARSARMPRTLLSILFVLIAGAATLGLTGCGSGGFFAQDPQTYTVTITATATAPANTTLQHTTTVTLAIQ